MHPVTLPMSGVREMHPVMSDMQGLHPVSRNGVQLTTPRGAAHDRNGVQELHPNQKQKQSKSNPKSKSTMSGLRPNYLNPGHASQVRKSSPTGWPIGRRGARRCRKR